MGKILGPGARRQLARDRAKAEAVEAQYGPLPPEYDPPSRQVRRWLDRRGGIWPRGKLMPAGGRDYQRKTPMRGPQGFDLTKIKNPEKYLHSMARRMGALKSFIAGQSPSPPGGAS